MIILMKRSMKKKKLFNVRRVSFGCCIWIVAACSRKITETSRILGS